MNVLIAVLVVLALSGILAGTLGNKFKASKQKSQTPTPDKGKASGGMLNTLRGKTQSVTGHITWKNGLAAFGAVAIFFSIVGWMKSENIVMAETTYTLPELCAGKRYDVLFVAKDKKKQEIVLANGYTFQDVDLRLLYRNVDGSTTEYRVGNDGNSLIDKEGDVTPYKVQSPPTQGGFYVKIGENAMRKVPAGTIRIENKFTDYELEKMAKAKAEA
ncbi:MAG: hypothetical protein QG580_403 [Patescibacteria group bacterium]|jgi:hypothetical protein|nr:hypothetical protein [Patescibacteria group bacterium]